MIDSDRDPRNGTSARPQRPAEPVAPDEATAYAGLVTRTLAFLLDAALVNLVALIATGVVGLTVSTLVGDPEITGAGVLAGTLAFGLWTTAYFAVGWSVGGQTIGNAVLGIRVVDGRTGRPLAPCRAVLRLPLITISAIPLMAGLWILLWDPRRRTLHDRVIRSVVVRVDASRSID